MRSRASNTATDPRTSISTCRNDASSIALIAASLSSRLSKPPCRLNACRVRRASHVCGPASPSTDAPNSRPFGPRIVYHARRAVREVEARFAARYLSLDELLRTSTIVSLHVPLTPETQGLIGAAELAAI